MMKDIKAELLNDFLLLNFFQKNSSNCTTIRQDLLISEKKVVFIDKRNRITVKDPQQWRNYIGPTLGIAEVGSKRPSAMLTPNSTEAHELSLS